MVVVFVTVLAPFGKLIGTLYVLIRSARGTPAPPSAPRLRLAERLRPWSMIEVFVFGVFVAYVKLGDLVQIRLDPGVYALLALTFVLVWTDGALDREAVWDRLGRTDAATGPRPAASVGRHGGMAIGCETCGLVSTPPPADRAARAAIRALHERKPDSMARTWALVIAAAVLYVPANYYPGSDGGAARRRRSQHDPRRRARNCWRHACTRSPHWCSSPASRCRC